MTVQMGTQPSQLMAAKVTVSDLRRSYDFYTKVIGLKEVEGPGFTKAVLDASEIAYTDAKLNFTGSPLDPFLILRKQKNVVPIAEYTRLTWLVIKTEDVRGTVARVRATGYPVRLEPKETMGAVVAWVGDPDGYVVELFSIESTEASTSN